MGNNTVKAGETETVINKAGTYTVSTSGNVIRVSERRKNASSGRKVKPATTFHVDLGRGEKFFVYNPGPSDAELEVTEQ